MATIASNVLANALEGADQNSYETASVSPASNALIIATVKQVRSAGSPTKPTCSGNGLTWVEIGHVEYGTVSSPLFAFTTFRAMGASPSSGAITFDFSGQTQDLAVWSVIEYTNVDTSGTNGSGAIVQAVDGTPLDTQTTYSVALAPFGDGENTTVGILGNNTTTGIVAGFGFAELTYTEGFQVHSRVDPDTVVDWTLDSSHVGGFAFEIKNASQSGLIFADLVLENQDTVNRATYTTASWTPPADKLILLFVTVANQGIGVPIVTDTVTGNNLTWVKVDEVQFDPIASTRRSISVWRALGSSPTTGVTTINHDDTSTHTIWTFVAFDNCDTGGANGADAIVQTANNRLDSNTTITATLSSFGNSNNATVGCIGQLFSGTPCTPGSGFTNVSTISAAGSTPLFQWRKDNDTSVDGTSTGTGDMCAIAIELKSNLSTGARFAGTSGHLGMMLGW